MSAVVSDDGFSLQPPSVSSAPKIAKELLEWLSHPEHNAAGTQFAQNLTTILETFFGSKGRSMKVKREKMWGYIISCAHQQNTQRAGQVFYTKVLILKHVLSSSNVLQILCSRR